MAIQTSVLDSCGVSEQLGISDVQKKKGRTAFFVWCLWGWFFFFFPPQKDYQFACVKTKAFLSLFVVGGFFLFVFSPLRRAVSPRGLCGQQPPEGALPMREHARPGQPGTLTWLLSRGFRVKPAVSVVQQSAVWNREP